MKSFHFNIGVITLLLFFACASTANIPSLSKVEKKESLSFPLQRKLNQDINKYKLLVDEMLASRTVAVNIVKKLKWKLEKNLPLSGKDLDILNQGMLHQMSLRKKIFDIARQYEHSQKMFNRYDDRLKGVMLSLSASLILYDNYLAMVSVFEEEEELRRFLNGKDSGYKIRHNELAEVTLSYNSIKNRSRVKELIKFYEKKKKTTDFSKDKNLGYLNKLIENSLSYNMTRKFSPLSVAGRKLKFMHAITSDSLHEFAKNEFNLFSKLFGNSVGTVATRKGKLYNREDVLDYLTNQLRACDILLEKTPFRLTDKFIPGHWGHAAIWIGTEKELKKLGIWNHPVVTPYQSIIKKGHCIVEALRPGVQLNTLRHFLNIDDIAIIRPRLNTNQLAERVILSLRQVGKEYDFNFDVETTDKIVCSELIYTVYIDIDWPTGKTLGRYTISPDNVAEKTFNNGPLALITFYHDGNIVTNNPLLRIKELVESADE
jgi:uncharacterized protein YycO